MAYMNTALKHFFRFFFPNLAGFYVQRFLYLRVNTSYMGNYEEKQRWLPNRRRVEEKYTFFGAFSPQWWRRFHIGLTCKEACFSSWKGSALECVFSREKRLVCKGNILSLEWEAGKSCPDKNVFSSRTERHEGKCCLKRLVRASLCLYRVLLIAKSRGLTEIIFISYVIKM